MHVTKLKCYARTGHHPFPWKILPSRKASFTSILKTVEKRGKLSTIDFHSSPPFRTFEIPCTGSSFPTFLFFYSCKMLFTRRNFHRKRTPVLWRTKDRCWTRKEKRTLMSFFYMQGTG